MIENNYMVSIWLICIVVFMSRLVVAWQSWPRDFSFTTPFPDCTVGHTHPPTCSQGHGKLMPQKLDKGYTSKPKYHQCHLKSENSKSLFSCGGLHYFPKCFTLPRIHILCHLTSQFLPLKWQSIFPQLQTLG